MGPGWWSGYKEAKKNRLKQIPSAKGLPGLWMGPGYIARPSTPIPWVWGANGTTSFRTPPANAQLSTVRLMARTPRDMFVYRRSHCYGTVLPYNTCMLQPQKTNHLNNNLVWRTMAHYSAYYSLHVLVPYKMGLPAGRSPNDSLRRWSGQPGVRPPACV